MRTAAAESAHNKDMEELAAGLLRKFKNSGAPVVFVIFSDWHRDLLKTELKRQHIPFIAVDEYLEHRLSAMHLSPEQIYADGHPNPQTNELIGDYILAELRKLSNGSAS